MMEMKMTTDLETALPAEIGFNFDELKAELEERLHHYNTLVVTEDAIQDAKSDRANLRKLRDALETRRKEVKKKCEQPYKAFEARVRELTALIDAPIAAIDGQVKAFEQQEKDAKMAEIEAAYDELVPETFREIIPLNRILDPKWLNKSTTMKSVREAIETRVKRTNVDMALIDGVQPQYLTAVRAKYIETLDVNTAMDERDKIMAAEQAFQQREAQRAAYQPQVENKPPVAAQEPVKEQPATRPSMNEKLYPLRLEFQITQPQATALKQFLVDNHIQYRKII
ncbi:MAG: DUF1351 domain-containing protein [Faecousia sp.]